jgi:small subunit ribosomal protein S13
LGRRNVFQVLKDADVAPDKKIAQLTSEEVTRLSREIDKLAVEGALKKQIGEEIKRLQTIGTYRGLRHTSGLPVRGQRTRSNARTRRGKRQTVGAMRKKDLTKLESAKKGKEDAGKEAKKKA